MAELKINDFRWNNVQAKIKNFAKKKFYKYRNFTGFLAYL